MLIFDNVSKKYNNKNIISHFSYKFKKGNIYAIVAKSGSGKTTLLKMIHKQIDDYSGKILYHNKDIKKIKNFVFEKICFVSQNCQLFEELTAFENVILPFILINKTNEKINNQAKKLFVYFQMSSLINQKAKNLSGGERQRIAIIQALLKNSEIILLDEPTSALDEHNTNLFVNYLEKIKKDHIVIMVTHQKNLAIKADVIIDLLKRQERIENVYEKKVHEEKIKFSKLSFLHKKVFTNKKIWNYLSVSIMSMGLIGIIISYQLKNFINEAAKIIIGSLTIENGITLKAKESAISVDFKSLNLEMNYIYYEGISTTIKEKIKQESIINEITFNLYEIKPTTFIFDNYLSTKDNFILSIPFYLKEYETENNYLLINYLNKSIKINIDEVIYNNEDNFYVYCNDINYLYHYFYDLKIDVLKDKYIYSTNIEKIYNYLNNTYSYYYFISDKINNLIKIEELDMPKINKEKLTNFIYENNIENYILSDYKNIYIDYNSGFIYCLKYFSSPIQIKIDETLNINEFAISKELEKNDDLKKIKNEMTLKYVDENESLPIIYLSSEQINKWCINNDLFVILIQSNKELISSNFVINSKLFNMSSFNVLNYITYFLSFFSIVILIYAIISIIIIFKNNYLSKKNDYVALYKHGIYFKHILKLICFDPLKNTIESSLNAFLIAVIFQVLLAFVFKISNNLSLTISFSLKFYLIILFSPTLIMLPSIIYLAIKSIKTKQ